VDRTLYIMEKVVYLLEFWITFLDNLFDQDCRNYSIDICFIFEVLEVKLDHPKLCEYFEANPNLAHETKLQCIDLCAIISKPVIVDTCTRNAGDKC